jgi:prepilin-type N-terminal cleavage/methylation domain-containing protein
MLKLKGNQAGDTIVEVLIAIAVVSLVLVGAYVSTDKNVQSTQDAQERTQAVKYVQTQIEYLRVAGTATNGHCFVGTTDTTPGLPGSDPCTIDTNGAQATAASQPAYRLRITTGVGGVYTIEASWDTLITGHLKDYVTMYYRPAVP